jgi:hypothetical protein
VPTTVVNIKTTKRYDEYIGRGTIYGNPYIIGKDGTREEVIKKYSDYFYKKLRNDWFRNKVLSLKNKSLGCWCKPLKCHGDVIVEYVNKPI